jgi:hypothetical protein
MGDKPARRPVEGAPRSAWGRPTITGAVTGRDQAAAMYRPALRTQTAPRVGASRAQSSLRSSLARERTQSIDPQHGARPVTWSDEVVTGR